MNKRYWSVRITRNPTRQDTEIEDLGVHIIASEEKPDVGFLFDHYSEGEGWETNMGPVEEVFKGHGWSFLKEQPLTSCEGCEVWILPESR